MNWLLLLIACLGSVALAIPAQAPGVKIKHQSLNAKESPKLLTVKDLYHKAQAVTVKVISGEVLGSGIVIKRQGQVYTVLTNAHVVRAGNPPYQIQTPDGHIYQSASFKTSDFKGNDLGLLQFRSTGAVYPVASMTASSTLEVGDEVFAGGFPFSAMADKQASSATPNPKLPKNMRKDKFTNKEFVFTMGRVSLVLDKALEGGYQIGYTNNIQKGMSGGPLLNRQGKVVGVNGMHAYPLWSDPYVFKDGSYPQQAMQARIISFSWAIPIDTVAQLAPQFVRPRDSRLSLTHQTFHYE
jgi:S1-C subfamily serine protease